ncbi:Ubiquitin [Gracilaria domingensis]|nr:Ubiquitin [Gracilaria domingensis]
MSSSDAPVVDVPEANAQPSQKKSGDEADVVIKNPTDGPGTLPFTLSLPVNTTVAELKNELCSKYPGSPPIQAQRLIYAGKLLRDGQKLHEFLSPLQQPGTPHTIHLVVSSPQQHRPTTQTNSSSNPSHTSASTSTDGAATGTQAPHLPQFAYNGHFLGGHVPLPLQEAVYAQHLQLVESLIARTLQNAPGAQPDPRVLAQMHAADIAAAAAAGNAPDGGAQPYAVPHQLPHGNGVFPGMVHMHPPVHVQNMPQMNMAAAQHTQTQQHAQEAQQQNAHAQPPHARHPRRFNGFHLDVHIGRLGVQNGMRNQANGQNQPHVRQFVFEIEINWALIAKLFLLVYVLGHEGNSGRLYSLIIAAMGIYLWQTGHLGWLRRVINTALPNPRRLIENLFPQQPEQPGLSEDAPRSPRARQNPYGYPALVLSFVYSFLYGFVCSLLPAWNPQPLPRIDQIVQNPERPQEEPNAAANHDHID